MFYNIFIFICVCIVICAVVVSLNLDKPWQSDFKQLKKQADHLWYVFDCEGHFFAKHGSTPASFLDKNGNDFALETLNIKDFSLLKLHPDSNIPSLAYPLDLHNVDIEKSELFIHVTFAPAAHACHWWKILLIEETYIICEHPIMGELHIPIKEPLAYKHVGDNVKIFSRVTQKDGLFLLTFEIWHHHYCE